ncbi:hypothetical protein [Zooshikella harenae]|uniref:PilZ domain-containing protein n=1 Tax=Zooshikella harenae TaxID=2827238 RepID=A0ABS5ZHQ1_9GAMM|nr:hypothetical protein [Zooshikella harenae]MBU2713591.1 hypothetical protein [Zooshikella harenae]
MFHTKSFTKKKVSWPTAILLNGDAIRVKLLEISEEAAVIESEGKFKENQRVKLISKAIINSEQVNIICNAYVRYTILCRTGYKIELKFDHLNDKIKSFLSFLL